MQARIFQFIFIFFTNRDDEYSSDKQLWFDLICPLDIDPQVVRFVYIQF